MVSSNSGLVWKGDTNCSATTLVDVLWKGTLVDVVEGIWATSGYSGTILWKPTQGPRATTLVL